MSPTPSILAITILLGTLNAGAAAVPPPPGGVSAPSQRLLVGEQFERKADGVPGWLVQLQCPPTSWAVVAAVFAGSPSLHGATDPPTEPIDEAVLDRAAATAMLFERCAVERGDPVRVQEAIDLGADVNARNEQGKTPLMVALGDPFGPIQRREALAVVDTLLAAGADVRAVDNEGWSVFHWAAAGSMPEMITKLLDAGADLEKRGPGRLTPLMMTAMWNDFRGVIPILLEAGADVEARAEDGRTPLMCALAERSFSILAPGSDVDMVRSLLAAGAAVNVSDVSGRTPLLIAAAEARDPALLNVLLDAGADAAVGGPEGRTPLMTAVLENRSLPFFERLLQASGEVDAIDALDAEGFSALFLAATRSRVGLPLEKIALLVEAGADVNLASDEGLTPLCRAASESRDPEILRQLIAAGADLEVASCVFGTPLMSAAGYGDLETVEVLLSEGAEVGTADEKGRNALMRAAISDRGPSAKVEMLLAAGADIHAADKQGETPLMWGVGSRFSTKKYRSTLAVVSRLLAAGADVHARNGVGATALMKAAYWCDDPRVLLRLMQAGADVQYQVRSGVTALDGARNFKNTPEVIAVLEEAEASMRATGTVGYSPLMFAAAIDETPETLTQLIEAGAELDERGFGGGTALIKAARFNRNPDVIAILIAAGADPELRDDRGLTALDWALKNEALRDSDVIGELEIATGL